MTTTFLKASQIVSAARLFVFFMVMFFSASASAQEIKSETAVQTQRVASEGDNTESQMELVSWFMGTKQVPASSTSNSMNISTNNTGKKQLINCGMTPNRILSRAFLKKAINHDSTIA